ncbi:methyltransferase domain-containing protein [Stutzerimonas urumqiensis]|uniref:putative RNA methyltransferase n=1 Tax=Stutzerimonas urumqiensis TaxID=638269 RepID=UPI003DA66B2C
MLICPICQLPLDAADQGLACANRHRFDRARQGYFNLLPVQHKKSRDPGDNQAMVEARRRFLEAGHYAPLADRLAELSSLRTPGRWLDVGCGEGYYTDRIATARPGSEGYALDISREAIKRACRRTAHVTWLVASMARIPLAEASMAQLISVFSPFDWSEALRLLPSGGGVLRLGPTRNHLIELRQRLYDEVRDYDDTKHLTLIPNGMRLGHSETLEFELNLEDPQDRADLLAMTPHGWRANAERRKAVIDSPLKVRAAVRFDWIERH